MLMEPPAADKTPTPKRPRVFILEDSPLISLDLATAAEDLGCEVVGPVYALSPELTDIAERGDVDVAIIDIVLTNGNSDAIIRAFRERGVPVIISSGLMNTTVKHQYPDTEVLGKPFSLEELRSAMSRLLLPRSA